ncbi:hypothetical protein ANCDUO_02609 [Ancylostoma duodenale]|uniref:Uncharacterized protein n=1 Tax=Ancylostoma duodenale TaxID=51022 RepID=A0A0C2DBA3_9BILA|nr:hypothetical protein ANCDUO_02609 [Ancylostoma duodenale]
MHQQLLEGITFPYDDATRRKLLILYKQKESLLDSEIVQEHLLSQPLLGIVLLLFAVLSLTTFLFAIIFIACRALGNCGAKRYQPHPTNGRRYVFYLALIILSWVGLAGATIHFITAGAELWNLPIDSEDDAEHNSLVRLKYQRHAILMSSQRVVAVILAQFWFLRQHCHCHSREATSPYLLFLARPAVSIIS